MSLHCSAILSRATLNCCKSVHEVSIDTDVARRAGNPYGLLFNEELAEITELEGLVKPCADVAKKASMHGVRYFMTFQVMICH